MIQGPFYHLEVDFKTSKPTKTPSEAALSAPSPPPSPPPGPQVFPSLALWLCIAGPDYVTPSYSTPPPRFPGPAWCEYAGPQHPSPWAGYHGPSLLSFWPMTSASVLTQATALHSEAYSCGVHASFSCC